MTTTTPAIERAAELVHQWSHGKCDPLDECDMIKGTSAEGTTYAERVRSRTRDMVAAALDADELALGPLADDVHTRHCQCRPNLPGYECLKLRGRVATKVLAAILGEAAQ